MDSNDLETPDQPPKKPDHDSRRTHWRGFLKEAFGFSGARYLDMHLDPLGAPSPGKHLIRPVFLMMLFYGAVNATTHKEPLKELPWHLGASVAAYMVGRKMAKNLRRNSLDRAGNTEFEAAFGEHKVFDTQPDSNTPPTSQKDYSISTLLRDTTMYVIPGKGRVDMIGFGRGIPMMLSASAISGAAFHEVFLSKTPPAPIETFMFASLVGLGAYQYMKYRAMNKVLKGEWVISNEPPPKRQEQESFDIAPAFSAFGPAHQPIPVRK